MIPDDINQIMAEQIKAVLDYLKSNSWEQRFPDLKDDIDLLKICCKDFLDYKRKFDNKDCSLTDLIFIYLECADQIVLLKDKVGVKAKETEAAIKPG